MITGLSTLPFAMHTLPKGPIYYELRTKVLETFVDGASATLDHSPTLSDWFTNGTYSVASATSNEFILHVASVDFSSALLTDVEYLTNHCFEHLQEMICFHLDNRVRSDAWSVVTTYYFGFFCAQALLRLLGMPILFLKKDKIKALKLIGGVTTGPGAGAFSMEKIRDLSPSHAEYRLRSVDSKVHDATWKKVLLNLRGLVHNSVVATDVTEVCFYSDLTVTSLFGAYNNTYDWPSEIRTKANYPPGFAYRLVQNQNITKSRKMMDQWQSANKWSDVQGLLSSSVAGCVAGKNSDYYAHVNLLHDVAQCLFLLSRELYSELLVRRRIDKRWEHNRRRFRAIMDFPENSYSYLAQTY